MSEELLKIADGLLAVSEGVRASQERHIHVIVVKIRKKDEGRRMKKAEMRRVRRNKRMPLPLNRSVRSWHPNRRMEKRSRSKH